ncbi:MAG: hypothetical protein V5A57_00240 [Candidatus Paceibacterota bacterium]
MNKKLLILAIILILATVGVWLYSEGFLFYEGGSPQATTTESQATIFLFF